MRDKNLNLDFGVMVEGLVELDPVSGRPVLRVPVAEGPGQFLDVQAELEKYVGQHVRFICTPMESIAALAKLVESDEVVV